MIIIELYNHWRPKGVTPPPPRKIKINIEYGKCKKERLKRFSSDILSFSISRLKLVNFGLISLCYELFFF